MKKDFEDTENLSRDRVQLTPTKDGADVLVKTAYSNFKFQLSQKDLAVLMRDSLSLKDMEKTREAKAQRALGDNKRFYGHQY